MKTYKAYFSISKNTERSALLKLIKNSGLNIQAKATSSFSPEEAGSADIIFIDEKTVSHHGTALSNLKIENPYFLPVLLLASGKTDAGRSLPDCIDDVIFTSFSQTEWKRRIATYLRIREEEIKGLNRNENEFGTLFTESHSMMFLIDPETGQIEDANPAACRFYGYSHREMTSMRIQQINMLKQEQVFQELASAGSDKKNHFIFEHRLADGSIKTMEVYSGKVNHKGKPLLYSIVHDITKAKKTEKLLRENEEKYRSIFDTSSDLLAITEFVSGKYIETNNSFKGILGYTKDELLGKTSFELKVWANPEERKKMINALRKKGFVKDMESHFRGKGGNIINVLLSAQLITLQGNEYILSETHDITHLKKSEEALRESRQLFETLAKISPTGIFRTDAKGKTTYVNPQWTEITGVSFERSTKKGWADILPPNEKEKLLARWTSNMASKTFSKEKLRIVRTDGSVRWVLGHAIPEIHDGKFTGYVGTITDITDLIKAEQALRESENKYRSLAETSIDTILTYDLRGRITYINPAVKRIIGYIPKEVIGREFINFVPPNYKHIALATFSKGKHGGDTPLYELELVHKNGKKVLVEANATSIYDTEGKISGRLTIVRDITVRKKAERALQESERKYKEQSHLFRLMSDNIPDMVWAKDMEGCFTFVNKAFCEKLLIAKDTGEPIGKREPYFAERQRRLFPQIKNWYTFDILCSESDALVLKTKKPVRTDEFGYVQGKFLYLDVYKAPIFDENNQIIGTVGHGRDITKEKEAEKALLLRDKALNVAANAIIITNADGEIEWINKAFTKLSGYSEKEVLGKFTIDLVGTGKQDKAFYEKMHNILKSGQVWSGEFNDRRKNGTLYEVEEVITPVIDKNGKVEHLIGIMNDIGARKTAERELLAAKETAEESSRLKSAFLANMNHEIRTPMNAIMGFSELMLEASSKEKTTYAKIVNNSAGQLLHLIDDVIFLSRLQSEKLPVKKTIFSPANLISEILFMFDLPEVKKNLVLQTQFPENSESIAMEADSDKIKQVLSSFISNAIKYTEEGYVKLGFEIRNNNILFFEEDSGMGVPKKEQQRIFEAFFRGSMAMSSAIRGTGLGLNIAKELVELMGGTIGVSSKPGKGSRFYFILPYKTTKSTFTKAPAHKLKSKKWKELSILIAEDDETNFLYLEVLLKEKVNRVDRAINGKEAVEMVQKNTYDLILMDLKMPVMSGSEATVKIKRLYPHIPVIATTAYATAEERERALDAGCDDYLSKPIKKSDLIMHIEKYLSEEY